MAATANDRPQPNRAADPPEPQRPARPTLDIGGDTPLEITNFRASLPEPSSARQRAALVKALELEDLLDPDARHAVARAVLTPDVAAKLVRDRQYVTETVETATLWQLPCHVWRHELWPLQQPRVEAEALAVARPRTTGYTDDGRPQALQVLLFESEDHLREHLRQTIVHTRRSGNDYAASILARQVGRPILVHPVRITFADGTPSLTVMSVRDGITRVVSAQAALLPGTPTPDQVADALIADLMAEKAPRAGKQSDATQDHARGREELDRARRVRFAAGTAAGDPTEEALRIGQTESMPAQLYIGIDVAPDTAVPADEAFGEAVRAVVGSIHSEFKGWDQAAQAVDVGARALVRARHTGAVDDEVLALATGELDASHNGDVFGDHTIPPTDLWRAVYLVAWLAGPPAYEAIKQGLRSVLGMTVIQRQRFASYLGPFIDLPWRSTKSRSLQQARRAWANGGGPLPDGLLGRSWWPVPIDDFRLLVPEATVNDDEHRWTLQVAGGIALTADRLLASNVGSAVTSGEVPFRATPADIVTGLGNSAAGLMQLAIAANTFRSNLPALNSYSERDFKSGTPTPASYRVPAVDPTDPSRLRYDDAGQPVMLTQYELVRLSDPDRAARAERERSERRARSGQATAQNVSQQADALRADLRSSMAAADDALRQLLVLAGGPAAAEVGSAFTSREQWQTVSKLSQTVSALITVNEPAAHTVSGGDSGPGTGLDAAGDAGGDTDVDTDVEADTDGDVDGDVDGDTDGVRDGAW